MAVRKRGKGWMMDVYVDGNRQRQMIPNARLEKQAKKAEIKLQDQLFENKFNTRKEVPFLTDFFDEHFLPWSRANKRSWYHDGWRSASLKAFFKGKRLNEITPLLIEKFKNKEREAKTQRGEKQSPAAVNRKLELLSRILSMAVDFEMIETNPCRRVRKFSLNNRRERYLSREEEEKLMTMLVGRRAYLRPIVILALNTGMRRCEILNLEWWQVDFSSNRLIVTKTKSGKPRHIPMNQIVQETMCELKPEAKKKYVFESPKKEGHPLTEPKKAFNSAL